MYSYSFRRNQCFDGVMIEQATTNISKITQLRIYWISLFDFLEFLSLYTARNTLLYLKEYIFLVVCSKTCLLCHQARNRYGWSRPSPRVSFTTVLPVLKSKCTRHKHVVCRRKNTSCACLPCASERLNCVIYTAKHRLTRGRLPKEDGIC